MERLQIPMLCLLPHQRYAEYSLGKRTYDRHISDLGEEDTLSRLSPRLGLTIEKVAQERQNLRCQYPIHAL